MTTESVSKEPPEDGGIEGYLQWWKWGAIVVLTIAVGFLSGGTLAERAGTVVGTAVGMAVIFAIVTAIYRSGVSAVRRRYPYPAVMGGRKWMGVCLLSTVLTVPMMFLLVVGGATANPIGIFLVPYLFLSLLVAAATVLFRGARMGYVHVTSK